MEPDALREEVSGRLEVAFGVRPQERGGLCGPSVVDRAGGILERGVGVAIPVIVLVMIVVRRRSGMAADERGEGSGGKEGGDEA